MMLKTSAESSVKEILLRFKEWIFAGVIIFAATAIRMGILLNTVDYHGISNGKILQVLKIINDPINISYWASVHPPAHILFLIGGMKLFNPLIISPRMISLFFGIMTIVVFYLYIKTIFNREIALFSIVGVSLYSSHIIFSIIGTSETSFHFFLFLGLYIYESVRLKRKRYLLFLFGLCVGIASMCRYEGLLLIPFYMIFLRKEKLKLIEFIIYSSLIPAVWMAVNYLVFGNALEFILTNSFTVPFQFNWIREQGINIDFMHKLFFWPKSLILTLGGGVFYFGMGGICYCMLKKEIKLFTLLFIMFFAVFVFNTIRETLYLQPRYGITLGLILIPFSVYSFIKMLQLINKKVPKWVVLIMLWTMIIPIGKQVLAGPLFVPQFAQNIALYLKNNLDPNENIMIDHCGDAKHREPIKVLSNINPKRFFPVTKIINDKNGLVVDKNDFFKYLEKNHVTTLVYSPYGELNAILNLNAQSKPQQRQGFLFSLKYKSAPYFIYTIKKVDNNA